MSTDLLTDPHYQPWLFPKALYIHLPFCAHKCGYCDFAVVSGQDNAIDRYLLALEEEILQSGCSGHPTTIFVGGGTPTYLPEKQLEQFFTMLARYFPLAPGGEFSIESTPETLNPHKVAILQHAGVNRISLGVQSFQDALLLQLDRGHQSQQIDRAIELLKPAIPVLSIDLIFGIPGQSLSQWQLDLQRAVDFGLQHLSTYGLTYEKGTPLWKQVNQGLLAPLGDDLELEMYQLAIDFLETNGYQHYEISNFALSGSQCRHNHVYWANHAYWGYGLGAARYVQGRRETNTRNFDAYFAKVFTGQAPTFQSEVLSPSETAQETAAIQLRRTMGIQIDDFLKQTNYDIRDLLQSNLHNLVQQGYVLESTDSISLNKKGRPLADYLISKLVWG